MLGHCGICIFLQEVVFLEVKLLQFPFERDFVDRNFQATFDVKTRSALGPIQAGRQGSVVYAIFTFST